MFKIGEFSRLAQVTIETLRHYDKVGLLKPAQVDSFTGYRYYSAQQLQTLSHIRAFKDIGFSLEEIARILQERHSVETLKMMLKTQLLSAEEDLQMAQSRIDLIKARLNYLILENTMSNYEVNLKSIEPTMVAAIREVVPHADQMPARCSTLFDTIAQWMSTNKIPIGTPMTTYLNDSYTRDNIEIECAFTIPDNNALNSIQPEVPITLYQQDAIPQVAVTIVANDFHQKVDGLTPAYHALGQWLETHNYQIIGHPRELFYGSPHTNDLTAEIQFPVQKR